MAGGQKWEQNSDRPITEEKSKTQGARKRKNQQTSGRGKNTWAAGEKCNAHVAEGKNSNDRVSKKKKRETKISDQAPLPQ